MLSFYECVKMGKDEEGGVQTCRKYGQKTLLKNFN
jgi:hypothetical protein